MRWLLVLLAIVLGLERTAAACSNATMSEVTAVAQLKEAESALEQGDVLTARDLATEVTASYQNVWPEMARGLLNRSARVKALSWIRDPHATTEQINEAVGVLAARVSLRLEGNEPNTDPALSADYGEALERAGRVDEAYEVLLPLMAHDLMGSAYAYAALARAAKVKDDRMNSLTAASRCQRMAVAPSTCRGHYPSQPFMRGRPLDFAISALLLLGGALVRIVSKKQPWTRFRARELAIGVLASGALVFFLANIRHGTLAAVLALGAVVLMHVLERRLFLRAARAGVATGFRIRPAVPEDQAVPALRLWFGPLAPEMLEPTFAPGYRESARQAPLFRLEARRTSKLAIALIILAILMFGGCATSMLLFTRSF